MRVFLCHTMARFISVIRFIYVVGGFFKDLQCVMITNWVVVALYDVDYGCRWGFVSVQLITIFLIEALISMHIYIFYLLLYKHMYMLQFISIYLCLPLYIVTVHMPVCILLNHQTKILIAAIKTICFKFVQN